MESEQELPLEQDTTPPLLVIVIIGFFEHPLLCLILYEIFGVWGVMQQTQLLIYTAFAFLFVGMGGAIKYCVEQEMKYPLSGADDED